AVAAAEPVGPVTVIRRSWDLTRGHFGKLLGFILLVLLVFAIVSIVVGAVGGLLIVLLVGQPDPGSLSAFLIVLVGVAVNMVATVYLTALNARIYRQLSGGGAQDVFA
ncbi:MAG: hypothetical protein M3177_09005, partial [Pseudomonadota bacterium]|nr:hypothetical protein [Pseudomonadota bacterium]